MIYFIRLRNYFLIATKWLFIRDGVSNCQMSRSRHLNCVYWRKKNHLGLESLCDCMIIQDFTYVAQQTNTSLDNVDVYQLEASD